MQNFDRIYHNSIPLSQFQQAEACGVIQPGDVLIEATSGNAGIALAMNGYRPDGQSVQGPCRPPPGGTIDPVGQTEIADRRQTGLPPVRAPRRPFVFSGGGAVLRAGQPAGHQQPQRWGMGNGVWQPRRGDRHLGSPSPAGKMAVWLAQDITRFLKPE